jgi:hypothetical protein
MPRDLILAADDEGVVGNVLTALLRTPGLKPEGILDPLRT